MPATSYPKAIGGVCRTQSITQCIDAGQLNVLTQWRPIAFGLTRVTLN